MQNPLSDSPPLPQEPPLIERLVREHHAVWVAPGSALDWCDGTAHAVLLLAGDAVRFPEALDVAVVLPELLKACGTPCQVGVVHRNEEEHIARQFGSQRWPSLVFFRNGQYSTVLAGMHDWSDYVRLFAEALQQPPSRPPTIGIPVVAATASGHCPS